MSVNTLDLAHITRRLAAGASLTRVTDSQLCVLVQANPQCADDLVAAWVAARGGQLRASTCSFKYIPLRRLPNGVRAFSLNLSGCTLLEELPEDLVVRYRLYLTGCVSLRCLPPNLCTEEVILPLNYTGNRPVYVKRFSS